MTVEEALKNYGCGQNISQQIVGKKYHDNWVYIHVRNFCELC